MNFGEYQKAKDFLNGIYSQVEDNIVDYIMTHREKYKANWEVLSFCYNGASALITPKDDVDDPDYHVNLVLKERSLYVKIPQEVIKEHLPDPETFRNLQETLQYYEAHVVGVVFRMFSRRDPRIDVAHLDDFDSTDANGNRLYSGFQMLECSPDAEEVSFRSKKSYAHGGSGFTFSIPSSALRAPYFVMDPDVLELIKNY